MLDTIEKQAPAILSGCLPGQRASESATLSVSSAVTGIVEGYSPQDFAAPEGFWARCRFNQLVRSWKRETRHISSMTKTIMHPAYQAIIGMGRQALPFIFEELEHHGGHWFWALYAITQEDPARGSDDFAEAARAWLKWGRSNGYLQS
jgi:hypothetical protein